MQTCDQRRRNRCRAITVSIGQGITVFAFRQESVDKEKTL
jgi:hypothetical protein